VFDNTPLWVWLVGVIAALAASYPLWLPIWAWLPSPVRAALIALVAVIGAYLAGRKRGADNEQQRQKDSNAAAVQTSNEVESEVRNRSKPDLDKSYDRWMRKDG
jgi:membrane protein implicated in regulation of membrane protease activity